jgi:hypothetical protein
MLDSQQVINLKIMNIKTLLTSLLKNHDYS